jgi:hypothetical protein
VLAEIEQREQMGYNAPRSPLAGAYEVEAFVKGGVTLPPLTTDAIRWRTSSIRAFSEGMWIGVRLMNGERIGFRAEDDPATSTLALFTSSGEKTVMAYSRPEPEHLVLTGSYMNDTLTVHLRKFDPSKYLLINRGFHWINEFPYNR